MPEPEGNKFDFVDESHIRPDYLETFEFDSPNQYIMTETDEFSAVCPFSGLPDLAYVQIEYYPEGGKCVERIYTDLKSVLETEKLTVTTIYNTRGGFDTTCVEGSID